ncbi:MAG: thiamine diphosphokinase [Boseongicola sp.]|nr:thiamine diphosphokinase [Boseongicola sp.]
MTLGKVQSDTGVTLVGAGRPHAPDIAESMARAPYLVAADGGANSCIAAGTEPCVVIGDLDSITDETRAALREARIIEYADQDITDFEKCLRLIDAPFVIATGFTDGRLDHTLAVLSVVARCIGPPTLVLGNEDVAFAAPRQLVLDLPAGTRFSLFPMTPVTGSSTGLRWPIDGLTLDPLGRLGTSNQASGRVELAFDRPGCITLIPRVHVSLAVAALTGSAHAPGR